MTFRPSAAPILKLLFCASWALAVPATCAEARSPPTRPAAAAAPEAAGDPNAPTDEQAKVRRARIEAEAAKREAADKKRDARMNRLGSSICVGCGGPTVPFDPTGGEPPLRKSSSQKPAR
ncbi:hypothetical protein OPKNFCMD_4708 [Methylobacterium crusticola]|uniref:Uncharacterized protein n=1 Tax=Methylobacterium crusticola TaxID=1697972 RepID=A0ABQ4R565_9HYPH|nr:hypothetical protein [Methylobacterium crusticola]GJD51949.1 hypothetical protein OPKNFCMD_4708 [Methylobacterium crusticola]